MNGTDMTPEAVAELFKEIDFNDPVVAKKANVFWKMLDRLAEKSPTEYRKFISEQLQHGCESSAFVQPWFCLKTELQEARVVELTKGDDERKKQMPRYINFCTSNGVKAPEGETVPVVVSKERKHYDDDEDDIGYFVYDAVFSSDVKTRAANDNMYLDDITKLALSCVEQTFEIKLRKRGYKLFLEGTSANYKGPFTWTKAGKEISHPERPPRKPENMTPLTLLADMKGSAANLEGEDAAASGKIKAESGMAVKIPGAGTHVTAVRLPLIQELGDVTT